MKRRVVTRQGVLALITENHSYEEAARRLGVPPGLAYLVATGVATDSSSALSEAELSRPGLLPAASHLSNPRVEQPDRSSHVREFLQDRVATDPQMRSAGER